MTTILKLGGSVITDKDRAETLDDAALEAAAEAIGNALARGQAADLVVVHGGGSFGHVNASDHGVSTTQGSHDVAALHDIHGAMKALNGFVLSRLLAADVPAVPVHPLSAGARTGDGSLELNAAAVTTFLGEGFVPVLHGDVIAHEGAGVTIVSGDEIVTDLATALEADRVGLCSTVPGVLDGEDAVIERIDDYGAVESVLGASDSTDVTGGMAAKVRALLGLEASASIFGPEALEAFLAGERPGTTIG